MTPTDPSFWMLVEKGGPFLIVVGVLAVLGYTGWKLIGVPLMNGIMVISGNVATSTHNLATIINKAGDNNSKQEMLIARLEDLRESGHADMRHHERRGA